MSETAAHLADLQRRLSNMIRIGIVSEVGDEKKDKDQKNRLKLSIGNNQTDWLPWLTQRAGACQTSWLPSIGEQVLMLSPSGELNNGIVLPSLATDQAQQAQPSLHQTHYPDGTIIEYDHQNHEMTINCVGNVAIQSKQATLKAESVTLDTSTTTITGNLSVKGNITSEKEVKAGNISLKNHTHIGDRGGNTSVPK